MLEAIIGSNVRESILIYLVVRKEGYAREIARFFETDISQIQKQLARLEEGNVLYHRIAGRTKLYSMNPRYPFIKELTDLINKVLSFYPPDEITRLTMERRRPRREGKPL